MELKIRRTFWRIRLIEDGTSHSCFFSSLFQFCLCIRLWAYLSTWKGVQTINNSKLCRGRKNEQFSSQFGTWIPGQMRTIAPPAWEPSAALITRSALRYCGATVLCWWTSKKWVFLTEEKFCCTSCFQRTVEWFRFLKFKSSEPPAVVRVGQVL